MASAAARVGPPPHSYFGQPATTNNPSHGLKISSHTLADNVLLPPAKPHIRSWGILSLCLLHLHGYQADDVIPSSTHTLMLLVHAWSAFS